MDQETSTAPRLVGGMAALRTELREAVARRPSRWPALGRLLLASDVIAGCAGGALGAVLFGAPVAEMAGAVAATWCVLAWLVGLYAGDDLRDWASGLGAMSKLLVCGLALTWPMYAIAGSLDAAHPAAAALVALGATVPLAGLTRSVARAAVHRDPELRQRVLIIGSGVIARRLGEQLHTHDHFGLDCVGFLDDDPHPHGGGGGLSHLGGLDELADVLERHRVDRVAIAFSRASHEELLLALRACRDRNVTVDIVPRLFEFLDTAPGMAQMGAVPLISVGVPRLSRSARGLKRALDLVGAGAGVLALSPLLIAIALAIRIESPGRALFRQTRMGRGGRPFRVYKFRSMYQDAEARKAELAAFNDQDDGVMFKIHADPRVTRVGRLLRKTSLDELPQLFNVLRGDMSLVGPRPLILEEAGALQEEWHQRRIDLRPGMTGPWQVGGRSHLTYQEMLRLDYAYVSGWTLARDIEMLLATIPSVLAGRGAY